MPFELIDLPYDDAALAPAISAETLSFHHGKHHRSYVDKTNEAIEGTDMAQLPLEDVIKLARSHDKGLFNNAAQVWNHGFYWHSMAPGAGGKPEGKLADMIDEAFGSLGEFAQKLAKTGAGHFASGWVWLAETDGALKLVETHDADTLADSGDSNPLLVIDVWEHAYYLDHQNKRPAYLEAVIDNLLNWEFAAENLERGTAWTYPAKVYA